MPCPPPPPSRRIIRPLFLRPWTPAARLNPALRDWLDGHGYITPHFSWASYRAHDSAGTWVPRHLMANAIRLHWDLEAFRHALGDVVMEVDGPYRTVAHNREVGGAEGSRHTTADAADFFLAQVDLWVKESPKLKSRMDVVAVADRIFSSGGVGNETSGTLHVDSRGYRSRFTTWTAAR